MRIISKRTLREYYSRHSKAEIPLRAWHAAAKEAHWNSFNELKMQFPAASIVGNDRVVFNIRGNDFRLIAKIDFEWQLIFVRFIGTLREYDKLDASKV